MRPVKGRYTENIVVDLDDTEVYYLIADALKEMYDVDPDCHIDRDGFLALNYEQYGGSHSWFETKVIRKATESDIEAVSVFKKLRQWRYECLTKGS